MSKPVTERELLEMQIKTYEFYARLIDRAVGAGKGAIMPKWDESRAEEYKRLAEELRARLAELDEQEAEQPSTDPVSTPGMSSPESKTEAVAAPLPE